MIRRSAAVSVAVTLEQLASGKLSGWSEDQELVLDALRRSKTSLNDATDEELSAYVTSMTPEQMRGVASNVKGIFHEMLVVSAENSDGDSLTAAMFEATNHPGADVEFVLEGVVVKEAQLKAVQSPSEIIEAFARYPDVDVIATSEVFGMLAETYGDRLSDSGISNDKISETTRQTLEELAGEDLGDLIQDGVITSVLVGGAIQAKAVLAGQPLDGRQMRSVLELAGIGAGTALTVDTLLNLI